MENRFQAMGELKGSVGTMQVLAHQGMLYVGTIAPGRGTQMIDVSNPRRPRPVGEIEGMTGSFSPKVQIGDNLLLVNYEERSVKASFVGFGVWDVSRPESPRLVSRFSTGGRGVHRMWYTGGRYVYLSAVPEGHERRMLVLVDVSNPEHPEEVSRWEPDVQAPAGLGFALHHAIVRDGVAYAGWWDYGVVLLDVADPRKPRMLSHTGGWAEPGGGGHTHTALPLLKRNLMVVTDEAGDDPGQQDKKFIRVFDIADKAHPRRLAQCPVPQGDWGRGGTRFGPHNLHENRRGSWDSEQYIFATYFGAGLRVYDLHDPADPKEAGFFLPPGCPAGAGPAGTGAPPVPACGAARLEPSPPHRRRSTTTQQSSSAPLQSCSTMRSVISEGSSDEWSCTKDRSAAIPSSRLTPRRSTTPSVTRTTPSWGRHAATRSDDAGLGAPRGGPPAPSM